MSQAKVDKYKEQKKHRAEIMKREKRERLITRIIVGVVVIGVVIWGGLSIYEAIDRNISDTYYVNTSALDDYLDVVNADETEAAEEDTTEAATEAETEEATEAATETETATETESESETKK